MIKNLKVLRVEGLRVFKYPGYLELVTQVVIVLCCCQCRAAETIKHQKR